MMTVCYSLLFSFGYVGYCPAELYENINWWKTKYGETDIQPCPSRYTGIYVITLLIK